MKFLKDPIKWYRLARFLGLWHVPVLPSLITNFMRMWFSCFIPYTAELGDDVVLGYGGLGVVIHKDAKIGNRVHIDQGVTVGGNARVYGVPTIGDDVYVGCGAKLLGPIHIGNGSVIGANAVVNTDIPSNCVAVGIPARVIKDDISINEYLYEV